MEYKRGKLKKIGKGAFTTAYLMENGRVMLKTTDRVKECAAIFGMCPDSDRFPDIYYVSEGIYEMEYFPRVKSLKNSLMPDEWRFYKELRKIDPWYFHDVKEYDRHDVFIKLVNALNIAENEKNNLISAWESCMNYGYDVAFEISPRNVAVKNGKLILLDCFFFISDLKKKYERN